jgi:hypothetical protein
VSAIHEMRVGCGLVGGGHSNGGSVLYEILEAKEVVARSSVIFTMDEFEMVGNSVFTDNAGRVAATGHGSWSSGWYYKGPHFSITLQQDRT